MAQPNSQFAFHNAPGFPSPQKKIPAKGVGVPGGRGVLTTGPNVPVPPAPGPTSLMTRIGQALIPPTDRSQPAVGSMAHPLQSLYRPPATVPNQPPSPPAPELRPTQTPFGRGDLSQVPSVLPPAQASPASSVAPAGSPPPGLPQAMGLQPGPGLGTTPIQPRTPSTAVPTTAGRPAPTSGLLEQLRAANPQQGSSVAVPSFDQALREGQAQGVGNIYGMGQPAGPAVMGYYQDQQARAAQLAASQAQVDQIGPGTGTFTDRMGGAPRQLPAIPPPEAQRGRPMIPMSDEERQRTLETLGAQASKDMARADMRQRIAMAGGMPQKRGPLATIMDNMLGRKQPGFNASTLSPEDQNVFADVQRTEAAKARRQAYLSGTGEYAGRGPTQRLQAVLAKRAPVTANAARDAEERRWRMNGGPQQQMLNNYMAARNPMLALGMMRQQHEAQQAELDRGIERQKLEIMQDNARGIRDDNKLQRLQDMEQSRNALAAQMAQFGVQNAQGERHFQQGQTQSEQQHAETMGKLDIQGKRADAEAEQNRITQRAQIAALINNDPKMSWEEKQKAIAAAMRGESYIPGNDGSQQQGMPIDFRGMTTEEIIARGRELYGKGPEADAQIRDLLQKKSGRRSATVTQPEGQGLWDALFGGTGFGRAQKISNWWNNR